MIESPILRSATFRTSTIVLLLTVLFDRFFWHQGLGLNLALFATAAMLGSLLVMRRTISIPARITLAAMLVCAAMVLVHGSIVAKVGTMLALAVSAVLLLEPTLRSLPHALAGSVVNLIYTPIGVASVMSDGLKQVPVTRTGWRWVRLAFVPVLVTLLFFLIYRAANPRFEALAANFFGDFFDAFWHVVAELFTPHMFFLGFGLLVSGALVQRSAPQLFTGPAWPLNGSLMRERKKRPHWMAPLSMGALERERRTGLVLLVLVNALLLIVNLVDISWVWIGFEVEEGFNLKQFVHEGTYLLILSILLSIGILLHLFRGNLNFHPKERPLRLLATAWIAQNFILGISVFLRNCHYIHFHGLAYKRIGVVVFLLLVLFGLVTLYLKIRERRTLNHLLRVNGWAAFAVMVGLTTVNWDGLIVRFNLAHWNQGEIDVDNYLVMSDKVLPLLYADLPKVEAQMAQHRQNRVRWVEHLDPSTFRMDLDRERQRFLRRYRDQDWRSWTLADQRTFEALNGKGLADLPAPWKRSPEAQRATQDPAAEVAAQGAPLEEATVVTDETQVNQ